jgi:plasmid stability protein
MAELRLSDIDESVMSALQRRARDRGVSLEDEVRSILRSSVGDGLEQLRREIDAVRAMTKRSLRPELDSVRIIREERDAWG